MSLSPDFINAARALAFYRKLKYRRARRGGQEYADCIGLRGWKLAGSGVYGEAWAHKDYPNLVVKVSGRAGFGEGETRGREPLLDGWPTFAEYCFANPHPNLPKIMHFERLSLGSSFGIMPYYESIEGDDDAEVVNRWGGYLAGGQGAPAWMWPIIGMGGALRMTVDLHTGNVMKDSDTGEYIMTDPFSGTAEIY